jgi:hypothetical protein
MQVYDGCTASEIKVRTALKPWQRGALWTPLFAAQIRSFSHLFPQEPMYCGRSRHVSREDRD